MATRVDQPPPGATHPSPAPLHAGSCLNLAPTSHTLSCKPTCFVGNNLSFLFSTVSPTQAVHCDNDDDDNNSNNNNSPSQPCCPPSQLHQHGLDLQSGSSSRPSRSKRATVPSALHVIEHGRPSLSPESISRPSCTRPRLASNEDSKVPLQWPSYPLCNFCEFGPLALLPGKLNPPSTDLVARCFMDHSMPMI